MSFLSLKVDFLLPTNDPVSFSPLLVLLSTLDLIPYESAKQGHDMQHNNNSFQISRMTKMDVK